MDIIGIIAEYNPFHNGHLYHISKIKEMYPNSIIILALNGYFLERGEISIESVKSKTLLALENNIDIVLQIPFLFGSNSADTFSDAAIELLHNLKVKKIVFGSECGNVTLLKDLAFKQLDDDYNVLVKEFMDLGCNYPTALNKALNSNLCTPNDLLAVSYIKTIIRNNYDIEPIAIKRTNDYHDTLSDTNIVSATNIREKLKNNIDINQFVPTSKYINKINYDLYFKLLKYKIITDDNLGKYLTVDEGIENRLLKVINDCDNLEELINKVKTKRYTFNRLNRMFIHILLGVRKEDRLNNTRNNYIRLLGFNSKGKKYINSIKKDTNIPIVSSLKNVNSVIKDYEVKAYEIYNMLVNEDILEFEKSNKIIQK